MAKKSIQEQFDELVASKMALWEKVKDKDWVPTPEWTEIEELDKKLWELKALLDAGPSSFEEREVE